MRQNRAPKDVGVGCCVFYRSDQNALRLCGSVSMFPGSYVPRVLCSPGPMFPDMYATGEHRTLFQKKGSMFPGLLIFPLLLPNSGRDNYHCMSLPFVEEGETSENLTQYIHTPVNKPREAQSPRELPALRPSGGAQSFWP